VNRNAYSALVFRSLSFDFPQLRVNRNKAYVIDRQFGDEGSAIA
jgi:hypothetical protein